MKSQQVKELAIHQETPKGSIAVWKSEWPTIPTIEFLESKSEGAVNRIIKLVEEDQSHKHKMDFAELKDMQFARFLCFLLCLTLIGSGTYLMATDHYVVGVGSVVTALIAVLGSLVSSYRKS